MHQTMEQERANAAAVAKHRRGVGLLLGLCLCVFIAFHDANNLHLLPKTLELFGAVAIGLSGAAVIILEVRGLWRARRNRANN